MAQEKPTNECYFHGNKPWSTPLLKNQSLQALLLVITKQIFLSLYYFVLSKPSSGE